MKKYIFLFILILHITGIFAQEQPVPTQSEELYELCGTENFAILEIIIAIAILITLFAIPAYFIITSLKKKGKRKGLKESHPDVKALIENGIILFRKKKFAEAYNSFFEALKLCPDNWRSILYIAVIWFENAIANKDDSLYKQAYDYYVKAYRLAIKKKTFFACVTEMLPIAESTAKDIRFLEFLEEKLHDLHDTSKIPSDMMTAYIADITYRLAIGRDDKRLLAEKTEQIALELIKAYEAEDHNAAISLISLYALSGNADKAFEWMDKAASHSKWNRAMIEENELLFSLHSDERFDRILKKYE